jgi:hypothetical protein
MMTVKVMDSSKRQGNSEGGCGRISLFGPFRALVVGGEVNELSSYSPARIDLKFRGDFILIVALSKHLTDGS